VNEKSTSSKAKATETKTQKSKSSPPAKTPKSNAKKSVSPGSAKAKAHLEKPLKSNSPNYRIQRELKAFIQDPPDNLSVKVGKNIRVWIVTMKGADNTIYEGESFMLRISFPKDYPTVPPSVYFLPPKIPLHEHIYSNGDICLSLLGKGWRPTMTAQSIALSILSILSSAQSKSLPMDNSRHAQNKPGEYQEAWVYHDDGTYNSTLGPLV
jgi:ubiquitin-conjugating enzyme E2 W